MLCHSSLGGVTPPQGGQRQFHKCKAHLVNVMLVSSREFYKTKIDLNPGSRPAAQPWSWLGLLSSFVFHSLPKDALTKILPDTEMQMVVVGAGRADLVQQWGSQSACANTTKQNVLGEFLGVGKLCDSTTRYY